MARGLRIPVNEAVCSSISCRDTHGGKVEEGGPDNTTKPRQRNRQRSTRPQQPSRWRKVVTKADLDRCSQVSRSPLTQPPLSREGIASGQIVWACLSHRFVYHNQIPANTLVLHNYLRSWHQKGEMELGKKMTISMIRYERVLTTNFCITF